MKPDFKLIDHAPIIIQGYKTSKGVFLKPEDAYKNRKKFNDRDGWREATGKKIHEDVENCLLIRFMDGGEIRYSEIKETIVK